MGQETAVLCSAGLDSAVLLAQEAARGSVQPIYVASGLAWEEAEQRFLERLLAAPLIRSHRGRVRPLVRLELSMRDIYPPTHWAIRGTPPAYHTSDEDVYLVGRNLVLLSKAGVYCGGRRIGRLAIGPLAGNPFPDATPEFFAAMARALSLGLDHAIDIVAPLATCTKADVIRMGAALGVPFELTLSCMAPEGDRHCGACSKCRERQHAFRDAGVEDPTEYVRTLSR